MGARVWSVQFAMHPRKERALHASQVPALASAMDSSPMMSFAGLSSGRSAAACASSHSTSSLLPDCVRGSSESTRGSHRVCIALFLLVLAPTSALAVSTGTHHALASIGPARCWEDRPLWQLRSPRSRPTRSRPARARPARACVPVDPASDEGEGSGEGAADVDKMTMKDNLIFVSYIGAFVGFFYVAAAAITFVTQ